MPADAAPAERRRAALRGHLDALHASDDRPAPVVQMVDSLPPDLRAAHVVHERRFGRVWLEVLNRGQREGAVPADVDLRFLRDVGVGALNGTAGAQRRRQSDLEATVDEIATLLSPCQRTGLTDASTHERISADKRSASSSMAR